MESKKEREKNKTVRVRTKRQKTPSVSMLCKDVPKNPLVILFIVATILAVWTRTSQAQETHTCVADTQCRHSATESPHPFCWKDGQCEKVHQLVLFSYRSEDGIPKIPEKDSLEPVFAEGEEMCVTVMVSPDIGYVDRVWNMTSEKDTQHEVVQERLVLFEKIPLRVTIDTLTMCSSLKPKSTWDPYDFDTIGNSYIQAYRADHPDTTGCRTNHPKTIRSVTVYDRNRPHSDLQPTHYESESGLSDRICFLPRAIGDPSVPVYIQAEVSIRIKGMQVGAVFYPMVRSFGLDPFQMHEEEEELGMEKICSSVEPKPKKSKKIRSHGNRNTQDDNEKPHCVERKKQSSRPASLFTVTSSDILLGNKPFQYVDKSVGAEEPVYEPSGDDLITLGGEEGQDDYSKLVGYYYYYDPVHGYYYYHPRITCNWDLEFDQGAGICEVPGAKITDAGHILMIVVVIIGFVVGSIFFFFVDWKSRVLFNR